jgi:type IV pilus assembly protein PilV
VIGALGQSLRRTRGFTLIEAMVALVVLSVGMLGIAGLYVTTLRSSGGAIYRMQAVNLATDMADRVRANRGNCYGTGSVDCAPAAMAANDLFVWQAQVIATLPSGNGVVAVAPGAAATDPFTYTITITWLGSGETAATQPSYVMTLQI